MEITTESVRELAELACLELADDESVIVPKVIE
jgi:Asp-tRNA(Asn)/Glu-tRNA(Gln) amidotransferase C subunit